MRLGPRVSKRLWEHDGVDVERMQTSAWDAEHTEGGEDIDGT